MDDRGVEAAITGEGEGFEGAEAEEEDDGPVTKEENLLLNTPPSPDLESVALDSTNPTSQESRSEVVENRQA